MTVQGVEQLLIPLGVQYLTLPAMHKLVGPVWTSAFKFQLLTRQEEDALADTIVMPDEESVVLMKKPLLQGMQPSAGTQTTALSELSTCLPVPRGAK